MPAKLAYYTGTMNSGKSTALLQHAYNLRQRGFNIMVFSSSLDDRFGVGKITSRIGINTDADVIPPNDLSVLYDAIDKIKSCSGCIQAIFVDECQFLSKEQVDLLSDIVDNYDVDVYCYGIKTDFSSALFTGSQRLLEFSDEQYELPNVCSCGKPAILNARLIESTDTVLIGGDDMYDSMCRKCYKKHTEK